MVSVIVLMVSPPWGQSWRLAALSLLTINLSGSSCYIFCTLSFLWTCWNILFPTDQVPGLLVEASWSKAGVVACGRPEAQLGLSHPGHLVVIVYSSNCGSNLYWFIEIQKIHFYRVQVRSLSTLVTHSLPNSVLFSKLDWCDPCMWRWQLKTWWGRYRCLC